MVEAQHRERVARIIDRFLETHAAAAHTHGLESGDARWTEGALALLGARRFFRPLMGDDEQGADDADPPL